MSRHVNDRLPLDIPPTSNMGTSHSPPRSPHSTASLPSPPSSPNHRDRDQNSIPGSPSSLASDFPLSSLNSSFFLSEQSSPIINPILPEDAPKMLIMPSLALAGSRHDPPLGESIGNVRLWVMGRHSHGCRSAAESLLEGSSSVMDVDPWTYTTDNYPILRASTIPSSSEVRVRRNIEVTLVEYDEHDVGSVRIHFFTALMENLGPLKPHAVFSTVLDVIHRPFSAVDRLLNTSEPSSTSFIPLLTSNSTQIYTALIFLYSTPNEPEISLIRDLGTHIPIIIVHLPTHSSHRRAVTTNPFTSAISSVRPSSLSQLREFLFHSPSILLHLRTEAAERFLRWRDLNAALRQLSSSTSSLGASHCSTIHRRPRSSTARGQHPDEVLPSKGWMWNWESHFSRDVHDAASNFGTENEREGEVNTLDHTSSSRTVGNLSRRSPRTGASNGLGHGGRSLNLPPHEHGDPLHLRSLASSLLSVAPILGLRLFGFGGRSSGSRSNPRPPTTTEASSAPPPSGRPAKPFSWGLFGLGVSVGVALSLCVVGLGLNFYKYYN